MLVWLGWGQGFLSRLSIVRGVMPISAPPRRSRGFVPSCMPCSARPMAWTLCGPGRMPGSVLLSVCVVRVAGWGCLREWVEPVDELADIDDCRDAGDELLRVGELRGVRYRRTGRRSIWQWDDA
jgi:hypothetical protein